MTQETITPGQMRELSFILGLGISDKMTKKHTQGWIRRKSQVSRIVGALLKASPKQDFDKLIRTMEVTLGLRFSDSVRKLLEETYKCKIVEIPVGLSYETIERHAPSFLPSDRRVGDETVFHILEAAWIPDERKMMIPSSCNRIFEDSTRAFEDFSRGFGGFAKAVVPSIALAGYLLFSELEDGIWSKPDTYVWTVDKPSFRGFDHYAVRIERGCSQGVLSTVWCSDSFDRLGHLKVIVPQLN